MGFRSKKLHKDIYENCIYIFLDSRFLRLLFYFRSEKKNFKTVGCAKVR